MRALEQVRIVGLVRGARQCAAIEAFRRIALQSERKHEGFSSKQLHRAFLDDPEVDPRV